MDVDLRSPLSPGPKFWVEVPPPPPRRTLTDTSERVDITLISDSERHSDSSSDPEGDPNDPESLDLQEIVGEHTWPDGKTYLYARFRDQSVRKVRTT